MSNECLPDNIDNSGIVDRGLNVLKLYDLHGAES